MGETTASVGVTGTNWAYLTNGVTFHYVAANSSTVKSAAATIATNTATATLSGLSAGTTYTLYASGTATNGDAVKSPETTFSTYTRKVTVTSISYTDLSSGYAPTSERAYLSANYTATLGDVELTPKAVGFCYGTSTTRANATSVTVTQAKLTAGSGSFYLWQYGLQPDTLYYWWAWVEVDGEKTYSDRKQFTTKEATAPVTPAIDKSWLEIPAAMSGSEMGGVTTSNLFLHTFYYGSTSDSNRNYTVCYDKGKLTTYWVAYPLNSSHLGSTDRTDAWAYVSSSLLSEDCQPYVKKSFYDAPSGGTNNYSKGHLLPSASRTNGTTMNEQTFLSVNLVPQIQTSFNNGVWSSLEGALQTIAKSKNLFVVTGTALQKGKDEEIGTMERTYDTTGKEISVPRYFYKVILKVNSTTNPTSASAIGFWFTNKSHSGSSYESFAMSVDAIEQKLGMDFFVNLPDSVEAAAESNTSWSTFQSF